MANAQALPEWKERVRSVSRCRWCAANATFLLAVHVCSVCKGEAGEIEGLVPIILRARLIVPEPALSVVIRVHQRTGRLSVPASQSHAEK